MIDLVGKEMSSINIGPAHGGHEYGELTLHTCHQTLIAIELNPLLKGFLHSKRYGDVRKIYVSAARPIDMAAAGQLVLTANPC